MLRHTAATVLALHLAGCASPPPPAAPGVSSDGVRALFAGQGVGPTADRVATWCASKGLAVTPKSTAALAEIGHDPASAAAMTCSRPTAGNPLRSALDLAANGRDESSDVRLVLDVFLLERPEGTRTVVRAYVETTKPFPGAQRYPLTDAASGNQVRQVLIQLGAT